MKDRPLQATIIDDELVVRIGVETLAFAAEHVELPIRGFGETVYPHWKVADAAELARDVCRKLSHEAEDGSSPLTQLFDEAIIEAYEDGSTGFADDEREPTE